MVSLGKSQPAVFYFRPQEKAMIPLNRYEEPDSGHRSLARPVMKKQTQIRGKCRAKYTFNAQNNRWAVFPVRGILREHWVFQRVGTLLMQGAWIP